MRTKLFLFAVFTMLLASLAVMTLPIQAATCEQVVVTRGSPPVTVESVTFKVKEFHQAPSVRVESEADRLCTNWTRDVISDLRYRTPEHRELNYIRVKPTDRLYRMDTSTRRVYPLRR